MLEKTQLNIISMINSFLMDYCSHFDELSLLEHQLAIEKIKFYSGVMNDIMKAIDLTELRDAIFAIEEKDGGLAQGCWELFKVDLVEESGLERSLQISREVNLMRQRPRDFLDRAVNPLLRTHVSESESPSTGSECSSRASFFSLPSIPESELEGMEELLTPRTTTV